MATPRKETYPYIGFIVALVLGVAIFVGVSYILNYFLNLPTTIPSTYQGTVQAIYTNNPSYVQFVGGTRWYGNLSKIANLSIGADCTLTSNEDSLTFSSGVCK